MKSLIFLTALFAVAFAYEEDPNCPFEYGLEVWSAKGGFSKLESKVNVTINTNPFYDLEDYSEIFDTELAPGQVVDRKVCDFENDIERIHTLTFSWDSIKPTDQDTIKLGSVRLVAKFLDYIRGINYRVFCSKETRYTGDAFPVKRNHPIELVDCTYINRVHKSYI